MAFVGNDDVELVAQTAFDGPALSFDFPGLLVGVAEYEEGPTGCTVFVFPEGVTTAIDVRGGLVGKTGDYDWNRAICLAGGSLYGLEAAHGVAAELFSQDGYSLDNFALVSGAIIFDYGGRETHIYPDAALGRAAARAATPGVFPLGPRGAGRSAGCGGVFDHARGEWTGQGGAFREIGLTRVAVFSVVNALGAIVARDGTVARGNRDPETGERQHPLATLEERLAAGKRTDSPNGNTTLTVLVTNQRLKENELRQLGRQVHSSMCRAIQPFHTIFDGDVLYACTTNGVENEAMTAASLGMIAGEVAWDAVLSSFV